VQPTPDILSSTYGNHHKKKLKVILKLPPPKKISVGLSPFPVILTTRIIIFLVGDPYKPSFATITGNGGQPKISGT